MSGYKTLVLMGSIFGVSSWYGPELDQAFTGSEVGMIVSLLSLVLRFLTHEPIGLFRLLEKWGS